MSAFWLSFIDFVKAGLHPRSPLAKAIVVAIALKICAVTAMRVFLFGADQRVVVTDVSISEAFGPGRAASSSHPSGPAPENQR